MHWSLFGMNTWWSSMPEECSHKATLALKIEKQFKQVFWSILQQGRTKYHHLWKICTHFTLDSVTMFLARVQSAWDALCQGLCYQNSLPLMHLIDNKRSPPLGEIWECHHWFSCLLYKCANQVGWFGIQNTWCIIAASLKLFYFFGKCLPAVKLCLRNGFTVSPI